MQIRETGRERDVYKEEERVVESDRVREQDSDRYKGMAGERHVERERGCTKGERERDRLCRS